jgi:hypothetical protein
VRYTIRSYHFIHEALGGHSVLSHFGEQNLQGEEVPLELAVPARVHESHAALTKALYDLVATRDHRPWLQTYEVLISHLTNSNKNLYYFQTAKLRSSYHLVKRA